MNDVQKPGVLTGALVGALLTAPLIAIFYLADRLAGLPFIPFDLFDWIGRHTPGDVITTVIDLMVDAIIALNLGETSSAAKTIEQLMALALALGAGITAGGLLFAVLNRLRISDPLTAGAVFGAVCGMIMVFISRSVNLTATASEGLQILWVLAAYVGWGVGFGWIYDLLLRLSPARQAPEDPSVRQLNRRQFLVQVGGATAALTVVGAGLSLLLDDSEEVASQPIQVASSDEVPPPTNPDASLEPAPGTRPEYTPLENHYRIDINTRPPVLEEAEWALAVSGLVAEVRQVTLEHLRSSYEPVDQFVTLSCISNRVGGTLISTTRWTGVPLHLLLDDWGVLPEAQYLKVSAADGFDEYVSIDLIRSDPRVMLTYAWDGQPLLNKHGFPLRIYIPDRYGMKQPKWITEIEAVDQWDEGYWVRRGWSETAIVRATSVVDTVAVDELVHDGDNILVPIGGIAYAGARGISRVEVQVDSGEWQEAQLRAPLSQTTWVLWRYDWPFAAGEHRFRVRCVDGQGTRQIERREDVRPDGATGIHAVQREIADV